MPTGAREAAHPRAGKSRIPLRPLRIHPSASSLTTTNAGSNPTEEGGFADVEEIRRRFRAVRAKGLPYLVAEIEGAVCGYAYAAPYHRRPAYRHAVENSVYVERGAVRRGLGGALLDSLIDSCAEMGLRQMVAVIGDSANTASIKLHERAGFRFVGALESIGFKHGRWLDCVIMQRALGVGDETAPS